MVPFTQLELIKPLTLQSPALILRTHSSEKYCNNLGYSSLPEPLILEQQENNNSALVNLPDFSNADPGAHHRGLNFSNIFSISLCKTRSRNPQTPTQCSTYPGHCHVMFATHNATSTPLPRLPPDVTSPISIRGDSYRCRLLLCAVTLLRSDHQQTRLEHTATSCRIMS